MAELGVEVVFGSTPTEEADVEQLNILQSWLAEGSLEGYVVTPFRATSLNSALTRVSRKNLPIINIDELIPEDAAKADGIKIVARIASNKRGSAIRRITPKMQANDERDADRHDNFQALFGKLKVFKLASPDNSIAERKFYIFRDARLG